MAKISEENTLIVVPTYNEADNIFALVYGIFSEVPDVHILFVDDNSQDGTQDKIAEEQKNYQGKIHLLGRAGKLGLGTAYVAGFKWALSKGYNYIIEMDADLSHDAKYLPQMLSALRHSDVAIGSRYIPGGGTENWGMLRKIISRGGSLYAGFLLGMPVADITGGFNGWKREVLERINLDAVKSEGYSFQVELKYRAFLGGFKIREFPIIFVDRRVGQSKMSSKIVVEAMFRVWGLRAARRTLGGK